MSVFLEILRCILCCEEDRDYNEDRLLYTNTSRETRPLLTPYVVERIYERTRSSNGHTTCVPIYSSGPTSLTISSKAPQSSSKLLLPSSLSPAPSRAKALTSSSNPSTFSTKASPSSSKPPPSVKPTLSPATSNLIDQQRGVHYMWVEKATSPLYVIPNDVKGLIKRNKVPEVLKRPLSPSTYKDYFASLLYAEDFYIEKWSEFKLFNVTLELKEAALHKKSGKYRYSNDNDEKDDKIFVAFEIDSVREKRPFLLSRDFVFVRPSDRKTEPFQGIIYRVMHSTLVLAEFGDDFHSQHHSTRKYDVSFSFNRVCLKRAHQAVEAASDPLFRSFIFPECVSRKSISTSPPLHLCFPALDVDQNSAVRRISSVHGPPPYLVEGRDLCVTNAKKNGSYSRQLSRTGLVIQEAVIQIYKSSRKHRILICAPINGTGDFLLRSLKKAIPESDMFRVNAAFREIDGVPIDILPSCLYERECFVCPPLQELLKFRVMLCTFVSSFRLHNEGISAGHFSHIFLVDASSATEPEAMVALANLANEKVAVVVTGAPRNRSGWVRSDIARHNGLMVSYFERLRMREPYRSLDPTFIMKLVEPNDESDESHSDLSFSNVS